ncbi:MAG: BON domain-containing protein [Lysobacter sp.]|nr:BON domain-containing protein [Lysobacter sp.]
MNERDREQHGRHGVRHLGERLFGRRDESRDDDRDENTRGEGRDERYARSLRDTYNPEPQWLQQDRESESGRGRGSYAGTGREWGESDRADQHAYGRANRDYGARNYGQRDEQRMRDERDYDQRALGQRPQSRSTGQDYRSGYETSSWDDDELDFNTRRYEPFHVGTGMGLGPTGRTDLEFGQGYGRSSGYAIHQSGYGSRGGWDVGAHQRDWVGEQRHSYRGMGPQSYKRSDERIREDIFERLTDSHTIDARSILVDVNQGNVTLSGTVSERRMRYAAEDLVERIGGVANINNQLRVQQGDASTPGSASSDNERH